MKTKAVVKSRAKQVISTKTRTAVGVLMLASLFIGLSFAGMMFSNDAHQLNAKPAFVSDNTKSKNKQIVFDPIMIKNDTGELICLNGPSQ